jgi:hypothetical protein
MIALLKTFTAPILDMVKYTMKNFVRRIEDFVCENCGQRVVGDGYTDHCPKCLWGKHVDREIPGDRASECRGMMEPIKSSFEKGEFKILYQCSGCNHNFWVRCDKNDDRERLMALVNN